MAQTGFLALDLLDILNAVALRTEVFCQALPAGPKRTLCLEKEDCGVGAARSGEAEEPGQGGRSTRDKQRSAYRQDLCGH